MDSLESIDHVLFKEAQIWLRLFVNPRLLLLGTFNYEN